MLRYVTALLLLGLALGQRHSFKYDDCGSTAKIKLAEIEPCSSDPCEFKRGSETKIHFSIIADQDSKKATLNAKVWALMFWMKVPGLKSDLCSYMVKCPIKKGQEYNGTLVMPIPRAAFPMETSAKFELKLDHGVSVCTSTKVKVV
ncbi:mite group 2 allergen-like Ixo r 2 [Haemaphysalis longicornis]